MKQAVKGPARIVKIPGYVVEKKLGESPQSIIYKGYSRKRPEIPLAIKVLKVGALSGLQKTHFKQKVEHLKILNDATLLRPLAFEITRGIQLVTRDYFEGIPLSAWVAKHDAISLADFFSIGCQLAGSLAKVHEAGVVHGGIKPHNILVDPDRLGVRLIDFITALDVREVSHFIFDVAFVKDTLAYTSPEQTGRINHRVDFRTDLYSLGVVFYELLTGRLPFFSLDPLELIHSHLAEEATPVHELNPEVPEMVGEIIAKLISKQPEKRYQSAEGLLADLERCRGECHQKGSVERFALGRYDATHRVRFISKMVGRSVQAKMILEEYQKAASGAFSSLLISGLPGIGKTRLIQELQRPIVKHRGYFTSGKFDIYQRNIPYGALIQSFRSLIRTFLTESDDRAEMWKSKIQDAVGAHGRVLTEVIPELEVLIGAQPEVEQLPPVESRNRFNDVINAFLICLASDEHPLTIFIDDLQWCDSATFDFLGNVFASTKDYQHLFLLGAYRSNEVDSRHPLVKLIEEVKAGGWPLKEIELGPLAPKDCLEMVSYILDSPSEKTFELSEFIANLSDGNPLFVSEILSYFHNENLLHLNDQKVWQWNLDQIRKSNMPSTVVALFSAKVRKLELETVDMLEYCACMGNRFLPSEVSAAKETKLVDTFQILKSALAQGLLMENKESLQFVHDRVQEAVLSAIEPARRRKIHWEIGTHLLSEVPQEMELEKLDNLFQIVAHLNMGRSRKLPKETAYLLSRLNHKAGDKALKALAADAANEYFRTAKKLLPQESWREEYENTFTIYRKAAKTELMCGHHTISERLLNELLDNAATDLDKAEALAEQTTSLSSIGNFKKAVETANRGLAYFEKAIPADHREADAKREKIMRDIESMDIDVWKTILTMPFTEMRKSKIELAFYSELIPDLYMSGLVPQLYLSAAQSTQHCLTGGMDESVVYSFAIMGLALGEKGSFEQAFKYQDLAHQLCERYPNTFGSTRGINGIVWCNMHSRSTPAEIIDYCNKGIQYGRNSGDLYNAGLCYGPLMWNQQVEGADFATIEASAQECLEFSKKYQLNFSVHLAEAVQAAWVEPMKKDYVAPPMKEKLKAWEKDDHIAAVGSYFVLKGLASYYFGRYGLAERYLQEVKRCLRGLTDNVLKRQWHVFLVLNALRLHERKEGYEDKEDLFAYITPAIESIETWAELGPLLKPYLALLRAEVERVTGSSSLAKGLYLDAIALARKHGYVFLEAFSNESLGELLEKESSGNPAIFFQEAVRLYRACHAEGKEADLALRFASYIDEEFVDTTQSEEEGAGSALPTLDVAYLVKSSTAISSEIEENQLIDKIMRVVIEASGAQHGYLVIPNEGRLLVKAESHVPKKNVVRRSQPLEECHGICRSIVRYVSRTRNPVILDNACEEGPFADNPEVQALKLGSVLCLPIVRGTELVGIIYLENRLAERVFSPEKTEMTKLLTYQVAISLENARLVERMGLAIQDARLAALVESSEDAIIGAAPDGTIATWNRGAGQIYGYSAAEAVGRNVSMLIPPDRPSERSHILEKLERGERIRHYDTVRVRKSGKPIDVAISMSPIKNGDGAVIGASLFERDISERKKYEQRMLNLNRSLEQAVNQLEASNKELEAFSYSVSHDLSAPLRSIDGFSQAVLDDYGDLLDDTGKDYLRRVRRATQHMAQLIDDMLKLSRITKADMHNEPVDLTEMVRQITADLQLQHPERRVDFSIAEGVVAHGDPRMLRMVFDNLLGNAFKFTSKRELAKVEFGAMSLEGVPVYFVRDNGAGFDMAYASKLFTAFQRLHSMKEFPGTGIGLAIVQRIVKRHAGAAWAHGEVGKGATFYISLKESIGGTLSENG